MSDTLWINTFAVSFATFSAVSASVFVTEILIISVFFSCVTVILFFRSSSSKLIPKFDITCLRTLLLCTSVLYVDTNFEFRVISVVVIVVSDEFPDVA